MEWVRRHSVLSYFVVAYALSWSVAIPLALQAQGVWAGRLPWWLHYATACGPAVAARLMTALLREPSGGRERRERFAYSTRSIFWWGVGFASPLALFTMGQVAARLAGHTVPAWGTLGRISFLPDLGVAAWGLWFLTSGCGEEYGWRGFALPRLQQRHSAMTSSVLVAIGWAGWHLPAFFYMPSYTAMGARIVPGFLIGMLAGSMALTWLRNASGGSVMAAALWHASFNFVTASPSAGSTSAAVTSTLVIVWAVIVAWRYDWTTLATRTPHQVDSLTHGMTFRPNVPGRDPANWFGATTREMRMPLPGDELIPRPTLAVTHAVTMQASPERIWPWLVQIGQGRAGFYADSRWWDAIVDGYYGVLSREQGQAPVGYRKRDTGITPAWQALHVGDAIADGPPGTAHYIVRRVDPYHALVLFTDTHLSYAVPRALRPRVAAELTVSYLLVPLNRDETRILRRMRMTCRPVWFRLLIVPVLWFWGEVVTARHLLRGLKRRAEAPPW